jgi:hypothetical protein
LKHFEEEYSMPSFIEMDDDMDKYIDPESVNILS